MSILPTFLDHFISGPALPTPFFPSFYIPSELVVEPRELVFPPCLFPTLKSLMQGAPWAGSTDVRRMHLKGAPVLHHFPPLLPPMHKINLLVSVLSESEHFSTVSGLFSELSFLLLFREVIYLHSQQLDNLVFLSLSRVIAVQELLYLLLQFYFSVGINIPGKYQSLYQTPTIFNTLIERLLHSYLLAVVLSNKLKLNPRFMDLKSHWNEKGCWLHWACSSEDKCFATKM